MKKISCPEQLEQVGKKKDKIEAITVDVLKKKLNLVSEQADAETVQNEDSNIHSDSDEDLVLEEFGDEGNTESAASEDDDHHDDAAEPIPLVVRTRSGRYAGNWSLFQLQ